MGLNHQKIIKTREKMRVKQILRQKDRAILNQEILVRKREKRLRKLVEMMLKRENFMIQNKERGKLVITS